MSIDEKIKKFQLYLHNSIEFNGILHKQTIRISQKLDIFIIEKQRELIIGEFQNDKQMIIM